MSFTRMVALGAEPTKIRFNYTPAEIYNSVSLRTTYRANSIKNTEGEAQIEDLAISPDELDFVNEMLCEAIYDVAPEIFKTLDGLLIYTNTILAGATLPSYGFEIKSYPTYNFTILPALDKKIENLIRYTILRDWCQSIGNPNDLVIYAANIKTNLLKIKNLVFSLRKMQMT